MLGLEIHFLTGRYQASRADDRDRAEWPPHPARVYSALTAALHARGNDPEERAALEWLAGQGAPELVADRIDETYEAGRGLTWFVPVNDTNVLGNWLGKEADAMAAREALAGADPADKKAVKAAEREVTKREKQVAKAAEKAYAEPDGKVTKTGPADAASLLPSGRGKQARTFPSVAPPNPVVRLQWPEAEPDDATLRALDQLCAGVARIGHSRSLVSCLADRRREDPSWVPLEERAPGAEETVSLRVPLPNQLELLEREHARHRGVEGRVLPFRPVRYGAPGLASSSPRPDLAGDWIVLNRIGERKIAIEEVTVWTAALRKTLIRFAAEPVSPIISGHEGADKLTRPHVACLALPFTGSSWADGGVPGLAVLLPTQATHEERRAVHVALGRWRAHWRERKTAMRLCLDERRFVELEVASLPDRRQTLQRRTWARAATEWVSVTPIALGRNPGPLGSRTPSKARKAERSAVETIGRACELRGLPRPKTVILDHGSPIRGSAPARRFGPFPREQRKGKPRRVLIHARLEFDAPVEGPLVLGAGRFLGLGLMRPLPERDSASEDRASGETDAGTAETSAAKAAGREQT